jgi:flavin-dependent dehydrogenase
MADTHPYRLQDGARVGVIGGGPAGAFFAYFLLDMAAQAGRRVEVDIYEPRNFTQIGAQGCSGCAGIVSESLVQLLAEEGIDLPLSVVQREIDSYLIHMDVGSATITPPRPGKRIGVVHRGAGPRDLRQATWAGLDAYVLGLATAQGVQVIPQRVSDVVWADGRPTISTRVGGPRPYDLLAVTTGVNSAALKLFSEIVPGYQPPQTSKTFIREYFLGAATVDQALGNAIQVFLLDIPGLEFGMLIPKGEYMTVCLLGEEIDSDLVQQFLAAPEVRRCLPPDLALEKPSCQCAPRINTLGARQPYGDRVVFIGDSASTRLFKDCLLYTSPSPRDRQKSRMPSSA